MQISGQKIALSSTMELKSIMLRLENVETDGIFIKAEFYFIGIDKKGFVEYDIDKGEITRASYGDKNPLVDFVYGFGYIKMLFDIVQQLFLQIWHA